MLNPQRNAASSKRKFEIGITTFALFLCVFGLIGMSLISFFQTQSAFMPLNDPTMNFQGIEFGSWIAFLSALIFQYGQNAALYVKNTYTTGKVFIKLFNKWNIKDTTICWLAFWVCASIDAGTNCLWLYNQPEIRAQHIVFQVIEYSAMIMIVGVEEVLGIVLQALAHSFTLLRQVLASEKPVVQQAQKYQPKNSPRNNNQQPQQKPNPFFAPKEQQPKKHEPSYQNIQPNDKPPGKPSQSRLSTMQNSKNDTNWMEEAKKEQKRWTERDLYPKMDDSEEFPQ